MVSSSAVVCKASAQFLILRYVTVNSSVCVLLVGRVVVYSDWRRVCVCVYFDWQPVTGSCRLYSDRRPVTGQSCMCLICVWLATCHWAHWALYRKVKVYSYCMGILPLKFMLHVPPPLSIFNWLGFTHSVQCCKPLTTSKWISCLLVLLLFSISSSLFSFWSTAHCLNNCITILHNKLFLKFTFHLFFRHFWSRLLILWLCSGTTELYVHLWFFRY